MFHPIRPQISANYSLEAHASEKSMISKTITYLFHVFNRVISPFTHIYSIAFPSKTLHELVPFKETSPHVETGFHQILQNNFTKGHQSAVIALATATISAVVFGMYGREVEVPAEESSSFATWFWVAAASLGGVAISKTPLFSADSKKVLEVKPPIDLGRSLINLKVPLLEDLTIAVKKPQEPETETPGNPALKETGPTSSQQLEADLLEQVKKLCEESLKDIKNAQDLYFLLNASTKEGLDRLTNKLESQIAQIQSQIQAPETIPDNGKYASQVCSTVASNKKKITSFLQEWEKVGKKEVLLGGAGKGAILEEAKKLYENVILSLQGIIDQQDAKGTEAILTLQQELKNIQNELKEIEQALKDIDGTTKDHAEVLFKKAQDRKGRIVTLVLK